MTLTTQQIGKCGELLVQYKLLLYGIESAAMTTDSGIDLVAYSAKKADAFTIQVKTNLKPKPGGGRGRLSISWWMPEMLVSDLLAFVELERQKVWLIDSGMLPQLAQQHPTGRYHFFMTTDPGAKLRKDGKAYHEYEFEKYLLENQIPKLF